jgi:hypothetical protein
MYEVHRSKGRRREKEKERKREFRNIFTPAPASREGKYALTEP